MVASSMQAHYPWQHSQWEQMHRAKQDGRLAHAYLLHGQSGLGKFEFADALARSFLCDQPGVYHADKLLLTPSNNIIKISQVRALIDFSTQTSHADGLRIAIIYPA